MRIFRAAHPAHRIVGAVATMGLCFFFAARPALAKKKKHSADADAAVAAPDKKAPAKTGKSGKSTKAGKAGNTKAACTTAYNEAQQRAQSARLRDAKELLGKCALPACGPFLQKECTALYTQLDADIPTVVPVVTDAAGQPYTLVEVRMDGELLTSRLDGRALPVDPGKHDFSFSTDTGVFFTQNLTIVQGQRNRALMVKLKRPLPTRVLPSAGAEAKAAPGP